MWLASLALAAETHRSAQVAACAFPEGASGMVEPKPRVPRAESARPLLASSHVAIPLHGDEADRRLWVGGGARQGQAPASGDENLRVGPAGLEKPNPGPAWPTSAAGTRLGTQSRMAPRLFPCTFVAAAWTR